MAAALALLSSLLFGAGDFLGGGASRRNHVLVVVAVSHVVGLGLILAAAPFMADEATLEDLVYGLGAGAFGLVGIGCLYHALGRGPMAVVAPVTAVTNAALPVLWGIGFGERLTTLQLAGVVVGMLAIFLVSRAPEDSSGTAAIGPVTPDLLLECLVAGAGFGGFFVLMDLTSADTAPWPLVSARILSAGVALLLLGRKRVLFLGHAQPAEVVCLAVLSSPLLVSPPLEDVLERCYPYTTLNNLDFLSHEGYSAWPPPAHAHTHAHTYRRACAHSTRTRARTPWPARPVVAPPHPSSLSSPSPSRVPVAGSTNPIFESHPEWWDVLCDIDTGKVVVSAPGEKGRKVLLPLPSPLPLLLLPLLPGEKGRKVRLERTPRSG